MLRIQKQPAPLPWQSVKSYQIFPFSFDGHRKYDILLRRCPAFKNYVHLAKWNEDVQCLILRELAIHGQTGAGVGKAVVQLQVCFR